MTLSFARHTWIISFFLRTKVNYGKIIKNETDLEVIDFNGLLWGIYAIHISDISMFKRRMKCR